VKGQSYNSVMVAWRDVLTNEEIAAIISFIRNSWGNEGSIVTPDQVAAIKEETASRGSRNWTAAELLNIPVQ
jgi:mono/diheme cytochrome c family protein